MKLLGRGGCSTADLTRATGSKSETIKHDITEFERLDMISSQRGKIKGKISHKLKFTPEFSAYNPEGGVMKTLEIFELISENRKKGLTTKELTDLSFLSSGTVARYLRLLKTIRWIIQVMEFKKGTSRKHAVYKPLVKLVAIDYRD